ncbi:MAG: amidophosphoribosyltransferase, partial [Lentisphaerae bacterium]|nr:amidophosphoribosyltransferase [Lentisphaerota bacterium]
ISDTDDQPLLMCSHLGNYSIVTVGRINNARQIIRKTIASPGIHFSEMTNGSFNATELVATLVNKEKNFVEGIRSAQDTIDGSCSILILTQDGIYAARDKYGRTPVIIGEAENGDLCVSTESSALPNLGFLTKKELGPGEIVLLSKAGMEQMQLPGNTMKICAFLWVYFGYPASSYENMNVEQVRYRSGAALAKRDHQKVDLVAGIPDSGSAHAIGYANESGIPLARPFVKYTPTWPRSFLPQNERDRKMIARMKLIPIRELIKGKRLLLCEDSIVRGTQMGRAIKSMYDYGAKEVHMRPACPPLIFSCKYLNFARSNSEMDLVARQAISAIEGKKNPDLMPYTVHGSKKYCAMNEWIRKKLKLTSLKYQTLDDMVAAIGIPPEKICTYCWNREG